VKSGDVLSGSFRYTNPTQNTVT